MTYIATISLVLSLLTRVQAEPKDANQGTVTLERLYQEELRIVRAAVDILTTVEDKATADRAIVRLRSLRNRAREWWASSDRFGAPTHEEKGAIEKTLLQEIDAISKALDSESIRLLMIDGGEEVKHELYTVQILMAVGDAGELSEWRWSKEKATLAYSIRHYLNDYDVEFVHGKKNSTPINIRTKNDRRLIYSLASGHECIVFARWNDKLFVAEYLRMVSGCTVVALDLNTGKQFWRSRLIGIGPIVHSKYLNLVNIETDGSRVIVTGNESQGRYVEHLDVNTGKTLVNKRQYSGEEIRLKN
jgi:hypothetical protein